MISYGVTVQMKLLRQTSCMVLILSLILQKVSFLFEFFTLATDSDKRVNKMKKGPYSTESHPKG